MVRKIKAKLVLRLRAEGFTGRQIAAQGMSRTSVAAVIEPELGHRSAILASVGAVTCGDAVAWCFV